MYDKKHSNKYGVTLTFHYFDLLCVRRDTGKGVRPFTIQEKDINKLVVCRTCKTNVIRTWTFTSRYFKIFFVKYSKTYCSYWKTCESKTNPLNNVAYKRTQKCSWSVLFISWKKIWCKLFWSFRILFFGTYVDGWLLMYMSKSLQVCNRENKCN